MLEKSLVLVLFIVLGIFLQKKISHASELKGIKLVILSIALPATIFIALLSIQLDSSYLLLPLVALAFNLIILGITYLSTPLFGFEKNSRDQRTMMMLLPSLAPGLSCFPFLSEYLGEDALALGALADVGNKVFVLILCYLIALHWYQRLSRERSGSSGRLKSLLISMFNEPINMVIAAALLLVAMGFSFSSLPLFLQNGMSKAALIMTPLILLFIGLSVKLNWIELRKMIFVLSWRSGCSFLLAGIFLFVIPALSVPLTLLIVVFPQSSVSFWPFAHMTTIDAMDRGKTFNSELAISVLACSLPFSTLTIMGVFSMRELFVQPWFVSIVGLCLISFSLTPAIIKFIGDRALSASEEKQGMAHEKYQYAE